MEERIQKIETTAKKTWPVVVAWIGGITAVIGFVGSVAGGVTWLINHHKHYLEYQSRMALAQTEAGQKQYRAALQTYGEVLQNAPFDQPALDAQLNTAMIWVENFEGTSDGNQSALDLDVLFPLLSSGLSRAKGARAADVEAHLGWAHFLNAKIAQREDDSAALDDWHGALATDPGNVYANAMLGNQILQSRGSLTEALAHFQKAVGDRRALPFVRELQLGGLIYFESPGARAETVRVANEMRKDGEQLDPGVRRRIRNWCFEPIVTTHQKIVEALSAVSNDDAWKTYLWLDVSTASEPEKERDLMQEFIHANLLELSGSRDAALREYQQILRTLQDQPGPLRDQTVAGIARVTRA
jgi:tetratricopeptide (TPR) repeat protein